ncbi:unnamed protein product [Lampetra fluviatilis]
MYGCVSLACRCRSRIVGPTSLPKPANGSESNPDGTYSAAQTRREGAQSIAPTESRASKSQRAIRVARRRACTDTLPAALGFHRSFERPHGMRLGKQTDARLTREEEESSEALELHSTAQ